MAELEGVSKQDDGVEKAKGETTAVSSEAIEEFQRAVRKDLEPYFKHAEEALNRAFKLLQAANAIRFEKAGTDLEDREAVSNDIFRSVIVLTHAYLEDFLRTLGTVFLPLATEPTLNGVPLVGLSESGRAEKFYLGKLAQHRGKGIDDVIRESIEEYLARTSFNSVTEIVSFLTPLGLMPQDRGQLPAIDAMIQRRHLIVHRADRIGGQLQILDANDVFEWVKATRLFISSLFVPIASKKYTAQFIAENFHIMVKES